MEASESAGDASINLTERGLEVKQNCRVSPSLGGVPSLLLRRRRRDLGPYPRPDRCDDSSRGVRKPELNLVFCSRIASSCNVDSSRICNRSYTRKQSVCSLASGTVEILRWRLSEAAIAQRLTTDRSRIDKATEWFERAWRADKRVRASDFLAKVAEPQTEVLLREPLQLERNLSGSTGDEPMAEECRRRSSGQGDAVTTDFRFAAALPDISPAPCPP